MFFRSFSRFHGSIARSHYSSTRRFRLAVGQPLPNCAPVSSTAHIENGTRRSFYTCDVLMKRRKTVEEKKSVRIIEYSPKKKKGVAKLEGVVDIWRHISVQELADSLQRSLDDVQEAMLYVKGADNIEPHARLDDLKIIQEICNKCGVKSRIVSTPVEEHDDDTDLGKYHDVTPRPPAPPEFLKPRPPVVTVMGHVDHGKTTLLDSLRGAAVAAGEAGGITQHIGAFTVKLANGEQVTFLDTPGHAAFSAMRARGAHVTDIIVLVVAAEDGVMAQTREVIQLALNENVPIIVAINKIDKPEANIEKTKRDLMQMGLVLEDEGGDIQAIPISALKGTNLELLTEAVSTQATIMGLKADPTGLIEGVVVESKTDSHRGKLSTAIVTRGTLRKGAVLVSGLAHAKVRGLFDHNGKPMTQAPPGTPVEILGWRELPFAGDIILEVESEKKAHSVLRWREHESKNHKAEEAIEEIRKKEEEHLAKYRAERDARRLAGKFRMRYGPREKETTEHDGVPRVSIIVKGDVHGSVEALLDVFDTYTNHERCRLDVVHYGVGNVTEGDIELAKAFNAIIYGFSVPAPPNAPKDVTIRCYDVIYRLIDDLKNELSSKLPAIEVDEIVGEANVLQQFFINEGRKEVPVAGCRCVKGVLKKAQKFRLVRDGETIYEGHLESMRHLKNEVDTIKKDVECGLRFKDTKVVPQVGDIIVCYTTRMEEQQTDWDPGF
ncbi:PREDICTED: translation initiation factor IF-2, mitochondrial [Rhagoletis zephyria]|uniref:translation initiation factor IF-2, mitochondrial n=1 Tax=Rhagoletis zephyria TaxID=28612 RepID=UPI0008118E66|nr:PREDICTED: translation initiation factor IF-2, mitochondrial [Rhagoletis zephyria]